MFYIHPEADPRDDDDENCWNVGLNKMETNAPIQVKFGSQTTIISYNGNYLLLGTKKLRYLPTVE